MLNTYLAYLQQQYSLKITMHIDIGFKPIVENYLFGINKTNIKYIDLCMDMVNMTMHFSVINL